MRALVWVLRVAYALVIARDVLAGRWLAVAFQGTIFAVLLLFAFLERQNKGYLHTDAALLGLFIAARFSWFYGVELASSVLGPDKLFHFLGGALVAWAAFHFYTDHIKQPWVLALTVVFVGLAVGAAWEVFEYLFFVLDPATMPITFQDSMLDLVADTLGACLTATIVLIHRLHK